MRTLCICGSAEALDERIHLSLGRNERDQRCRSARTGVSEGAPSSRSAPKAGGANGSLPPLTPARSASSAATQTTQREALDQDAPRLCRPACLDIAPMRCAPHRRSRGDDAPNQRRSHAQPPVHRSVAPCYSRVARIAGAAYALVPRNICGDEEGYGLQGMLLSRLLGGKDKDDKKQDKRAHAQ